jgi:hypothetical protein
LYCNSGYTTLKLAVVAGAATPDIAIIIAVGGVAMVDNTLLKLAAVEFHAATALMCGGGQGTVSRALQLHALQQWHCNYIP